MVINQGYTPGTVLQSSTSNKDSNVPESSGGAANQRREKKEIRKTSSPLLVTRISMSDLKEDLK